jgi:hypothetical protein
MAALKVTTIRMVLLMLLTDAQANLKILTATKIPMDALNLTMTKMVLLMQKINVQTFLNLSTASRTRMAALTKRLQKFLLKSFLKELTSKPVVWN